MLLTAVLQPTYSFRTLKLCFKALPFSILFTLANLLLTSSLRNKAVLQPYSVIARSQIEVLCSLLSAVFQGGLKWAGQSPRENSDNNHQEKADRHSHSLDSSTVPGGPQARCSDAAFLVDTWFWSFSLRVGLASIHVPWYTLSLSLKVSCFEENAGACWKPQLGRCCPAMLHWYPCIIFSHTQCPKWTGLVCYFI